MALGAPVLAAADTQGLSAYVHARVADARGETTRAADDYARALAASPDDATIALRAWREALSAGDMALATRAAASLTRSGVAPADVPLLAIAQAAAGNDPAALRAATARLAGSPLAVLAPSLRGWAAFADHEDPFAPIAAATDPVARRIAGENRALLLIASGQVAPGVAAVLAQGNSPGALDLRLNAARLLFGSDHAAEARALLPGTDPTLAALRLRGVGVTPSLAFGVSRLFVRLAADLGAETPPALGIALARAALVADPSSDRARLLLAQALSRDGATPLAQATLDTIAPDSPFADQARAARIGVLSAADDADAALAAARAAADAPGSTAIDWQRYADLLLAAGRAGDAVPWYRRTVEQAPGWSAWLQYGGALDEAGQWAEARPALERAVALAPGEPLALNYLGYALVDHGEDDATAQHLLERAHAAAPGDASIADSLGWAYYRAGQVARARPLIEGAAALQPTNPEIGEHLGDLYWTLGRRYEARYAWQAARVTAQPRDQARLAQKIATGLKSAG